MPQAGSLEAAGLSEYARSQENVEIVRRFFGAIARGQQDETPLDTMQRLALVSNPSARKKRGRLRLRSPARRRR
jgi:hypothetical protein